MCFVDGFLSISKSETLSIAQVCVVVIVIVRSRRVVVLIVVHELFLLLFAL